MKIKTYTLLTVLAISATSAAAQDRPRTCDEFPKLAQEAVSEHATDPKFLHSLLSPEFGPQLSRTFQPERVQEALGEALRPVDPCADCGASDDGHRDERSVKPGEILLRGADGSLLRADLAQGKVAYLNRGLSHDATADQQVKLTRDEAVRTALATAEAFGVPKRELDREFLQALELIAAGRDPEGRLEATRQLAEIHVRVPRRIDGTPVFDSYLQTAIGAHERVARLHVKWPDFELLRGLKAEHAVDREQVLADIVAQLNETALCDSLERLIAEVAYVQADQLAISSTEADEGDREETTADRAFVPALVVYAVPRTPEEDSGEVGFAGMQFVVPLLAPPGDAASDDEPAAG